jgi:hypothetical protein
MRMLSRLADLSLHSELELRKLLNEGQSLLSHLPTSMGDQIAATICASEERSPLASILCNELLNLPVSGEVSMQVEERQHSDDLALITQTIDSPTDRMYVSQRDFVDAPKFMADGPKFKSERKFDFGKGPAVTIVDETVSPVQILGSSFSQQLEERSMHDWEASRISPSRSSVSATTPSLSPSSRLGKIKSERKQKKDQNIQMLKDDWLSELGEISLVKSPKKSGLSPWSLKELDAQTLLQDLGKVSLVQKPPRFGVQNHHPTHGVGFSRQQAGLQIDVARLKNDIVPLQRQDDDPNHLGSHAWKCRDKDVSANPFIASTTTVRAIRTASKALESFVKIKPGHNADLISRLPSDDTAHRTEFVSSIGSYSSRQTIRRPATAVSMPQRSNELRPGSSDSLRSSDIGNKSKRHSRRPATAVSMPKTSKEVRSGSSDSLRASGMANIAPRPSSSISGTSTEGSLLVPCVRGSSETRNVVRNEHPTIYKLRTYESDTERQRKERKARKLESMKLHQHADCPPVVLPSPKEYSENAVLAVILLQRHFRGISVRASVKSLRKQTEVITSLLAIRKLKQSQINTHYNKIREQDWVGEYLKEERQRTVDNVDALFKQEQAESVEADKRAQKEMDELLAAEKTAIKELEEADEAEIRMEKERGEMLQWKIKVDRSRISYEETKKEFRIENDEDEEMLGMANPIALKEKKHYEAILARYQKEKEEYEQSRAVLAKERQESTEALARSHKEKLEWQESRDEALRERAELEAILLARKFTDPSVSVKERMRSLSGDASDAPRFLAVTKFGKSPITSSVGEIFAGHHDIYAGGFCIVKDVSQEDMRRAFFKHSVNSERVKLGKESEDKFLTQSGLQKAVREVGRRINNDEAARLIRSFDTDGNGYIDFAEFEAGIKNMVGMEMPHGFGQEIFQNGSQYAGEFYEDKRHGIGMFVEPLDHFYIGGWEMGVRHGKGIEGRFTSSKRDSMLPGAIVTCHHGGRVKFERFLAGNPAHYAMYRDWLQLCSTARKRAAKARRLVASDVHRHDMREQHKIEALSHIRELDLACGEDAVVTEAATTSGDQKAFPIKDDRGEISKISQHLIEGLEVTVETMYDAKGRFNDNVSFVH